MKIFLDRFVAMVCLLFLFVMLYFQNAAIAGPSGDEGDTRTLASHRIPESGDAGRGGPGWRFPDIFQRPQQGRVPAPRLEKVAPGAFRDREHPDRGGAGGRDAGQRERNEASGHRGHGGPQDL
jgi:hypothetical protein